VNSGPWLVGALLAVSVAGVARTQPRLAAVAHEVKERDEVYALPPPGELRAMALGYDAAAVDLLWAKLLVEYGIHWFEKREMHPDPYLDTILAIEPTYGPAYRFADTLLCYRPMHGTADDARKARAILERGTHERPGDYEVWLEYGQFSLYLGPSLLTDDAEKDVWRREGARALTHVAELGGDPSVSLAAANLLSRYGEREATIHALERNYAVSGDDPDRQAQILRKLAGLRASDEEEKSQRAMQHTLQTVNGMWKHEWPFLTFGAFLLIGPAPPVARCTGLAAADEPDCARDWGPFLSDDGP
jgi:hypothetical protein